MNARTIRFAARLALGLVISASLSACSTWRSQWDHPRTLLERAHPDEVRVVREDGAQTVLRQPSISEDRILGETERGKTAIPLSEVNHVDVKRGSGLLPAALISVVLTGGMLGWLAATWD